MTSAIAQAIKVLQDGGIVIYPTDTAFGIGCRIDSEDAVEKLFSIKKRENTQPVPVLVDRISMAKEYVESLPSDVEQKLMKQYWPGGLTIILQANKSKVLSLVRGQGDTIGIRMPNHQTVLELISGVGVPIIGTSANFHGKKTPYSEDQLDPELVKLVNIVVPGVCAQKLASTVIDCSISPWKIVREGAVKLEL